MRSLLQDTRVLTYLRVARDGAVTGANRVFARWTGIPRSDLLGQPISRVLTDEDKPRVQRWLEGHEPLPDQAFLLNFVSTSHYWHLRKIQEHMPLCMRCGKMKTGDAEWESLVDYLRSNDILVSHGYCPRCADDVLQEEGVTG